MCGGGTVFIGRFPSSEIDETFIGEIPERFEIKPTGFLAKGLQTRYLFLHKSQTLSVDR